MGIIEDTAADCEDVVTVQEKIVEDCIDRTKTVAEKVDEVNRMWMEVVAKKDEELECLTKKLEEERKDRGEELKEWKTKEDENTIEWKKDKKDMVQLRKTVEVLEEEIRKLRFMTEEVNKMLKEVVAIKDEELKCLNKKFEEERKETKEELKRKEKEMTVERDNDKEQLTQLRKMMEDLRWSLMKIG